MADLDPTRPLICYIRKLYADQFDDNCRSRYIQVIIYPTTAALRTAANSYARAQGKTEKFDDVGGCFHPTMMRARYDRRKKLWVDTTLPFSGVMRLSRDFLHPEVIAHESVHAALHVTRLHDWSKPGNEGHAHFDTCDDREEAFAYLLGSLTGELLAVTHRLQETETAA